MKKLTSILLACLLTLGCFALGGCGKAADDKQAFIASQSYYPQLVETLAAPVADIDADALAEAASGMTGRMKLGVEGLSSLGALAGDVGDSLALDLGFVTDGIAASGDLSLSLLGETLRALFATADEGDIVVSLPDLLERPLRIAPEMLPYAGYNNGGYDYDADDDLDDDDLGDEDFDDLGDEDFDDAFGEEDYDFDDPGETDDYDYDYDYDYDEAGSFPAFDAAYVSLAARYAESFLGNVSEDCYSSGREEFRTADGKAELDCLTLKADGNELLDALKKTLLEIADDEKLDEVFGEHADEARERIREAANEEIPQDVRSTCKDVELTWDRFSKGGKMIGERFGVKLDDDSKYKLEAGVDEGASSTLAFIKLTDEKQGVDTIDAESTVGSGSAELKLRVIADGVPYSFRISGKTTEQDGAKVTDADVRIGIGNVSVNLFRITTTVRAFTEDAIDFDLEFSISLPKLLVGSDVDLTLACSVQAQRDENAKPAAIDASGAYTQEEMRSEEFSAALESAFREKLPNLYALFTRGNGTETA